MCCTTLYSSTAAAAVSWNSTAYRYQCLILFPYRYMQCNWERDIDGEMKIEGIIYRLRRASRTSHSLFKTFLTSLYEFFKDLFYDNLPSDDIRDLPSFHAFTLGSLIYFLIIAIFLTFIIIGYLSDRSSKFLAVTSDSGECTTVSKTVSGQFLADINGEWEGSEYFTYSKAIYSFTLPNYAGNNKEYEYMMTRAFAQTEVTGQEGYQRNLGINILVWTVFSSTIRLGGSANKFSMSGSPRAVFDRRIFSAAFAGQEGQCPIRPQVSYNTESAQLTLLFEYQQFISSSKCMSIANPHHMGYIKYYSGQNFQIVFDARSALTALAINIGFLAIDELEIIPNTQFTDRIGDENFTVSQYYYPRYPGMRPLLCLESPRICVLQIYESYLYPLFNHLGGNPTLPLYCDCNVPEMISGGCNLFNFVSSFAFFDYNSSAGETSMTAIERLLIFSQSGTGEEINRKSFNASFYAVENPVYAPQSLDAYQRALEFCRVGSSYCSILSVLMMDGFEIIDGVVYNPGSEYTVSDNYYQLRYGACNNTFTISEEAKQKLIRSPPTPLVEPYYECKASKSSALITAWGISSGNMATVIPILAVTVLTIFFTFSNIRYRSIPRTYTSDDRASVLNYFAFNLLLIRDKRYNLSVGNGKHNQLSHHERYNGNEGQEGSVMRAIFEELSSYESIPRFFYDKETNNPPPQDIVLESVNGVMMTERNGTPSVAADGSTSPDYSANSSIPRYSVDAVMTESHYDQLVNPLYISSTTNSDR